MRLVRNPSRKHGEVVHNIMCSNCEPSHTHSALDTVPQREYVEEEMDKARASDRSRPSVSSVMQSAGPGSTPIIAEQVTRLYQRECVDILAHTMRQLNPLSLLCRPVQL